jgi:broad specificity phosphatase PhoE
MKKNSFFSLHSPTMKHKHIRLIRHAQSIANAGHPTTDHSTIELSVTGILQAAKLAHAIETAPDLLVLSKYSRTNQTAKPLMEKFKDCHVEVWPMVHEMNNLAPERCVNMTATERQPMAEAYWKTCDPDYLDGKGAETFHAFMERVNLFLEKIKQREEDNIIVVTHGRFMQAVVSRILQGDGFQNNKAFMKGFSQFFPIYFIPNCGVIDLIFLKNQWHVSGKQTL